jgi:spermidine/putrescine transport system ATP-binding protein
VGSSGVEVAGDQERLQRARGHVELEGISKYYPGNPVLAVSELDMEIRSGEFYSLLGPSGSGKTTTLRLIAGFERPSAGRVLIAGSDVTRLPPFKRPVNTVFQNYALFPHMSVQRNVSYPLRMARISKPDIKRRVDEVLGRVAMEEYADRMPNQLSGGQRQRVALARALVGEPELVLLDEPLGALDLKLRQEMQLVLKHLQRQVGITFVYVTHDQGEALAMSDRIAILSMGRVHQIASPSEVYQKPATAFVASFVGKTNLIECIGAGGTRVAADGIEFTVERPPAGARCVVSIRPEALRLGESAARCVNRISGLVEETVYQGHEIELRARSGGVTLTARAPISARIASGQQLDIGWDPADAIVVEAEGPDDVAALEEAQEEP